MEVAGRVVDGVIDERGVAPRAVRPGESPRVAGRRSPREERPGVFTLRVGNLPPGETATVRLSLVGPLPVDDGEVTFPLSPLVVAPRYVPGTALGGEQAGLGLAADTDLVPDAFADLASGTPARHFQPGPARAAPHDGGRGAASSRVEPARRDGRPGVTSR